MGQYSFHHTLPDIYTHHQVSQILNGLVSSVTLFALSPSLPALLRTGKSFTLGYRVKPSKAPMLRLIDPRLWWCYETNHWRGIDHGFIFGIANAPNLIPPPRCRRVEIKRRITISEL